MESNFIINKEPIKKNLSSTKSNVYSMRRLSTKIIKRYVDSFNSLKRYFQSTKSEIDFYYKFSPSLRRRNSIEGSKKYIKPKIPQIKRAKTIIDNHIITFKVIKLKEIGKENIMTAEKMYQLLKEKPNYKNVEQRINFLMSLKPFYEDYSQFDRHSEGILALIASEYQGKVFYANNIIFRYGDENNDFYLIHKGNVNIYCPFTESIYMNIDEFYIYLLRLRRYNEIEMLNDVLLMNNFVFMRSNEERFNFDEYVLKLYNTFIKLKFVPDNMSQRELKKYIEESNKVQNNKKNTNNGFEYISIDEYYNIIYRSFQDVDMLNLVLRIENEIIETMIYINSDEMKQIIEEKNFNGDIIKRIIKMPKYIIDSLKKINPDEVNTTNNDYIKRISPKRVLNVNLQKQKITIMRYLFVKTLSKGEYFGEFIPGTNEYFSSKLLKNMRKSKLNLSIHKYEHFYNVTAISANDFTYENPSNLLYLGHLRREYYNQYFKKFVEKMEYPKKRFILKSRLFQHNKSENLVRTYVKCFRKKTMKENECLISEKDDLKEDNTFIYFILKGEFQSFCNQTVESMDKILRALDCEEQLKQTIPIKLNKMKDTFFFEEICKKELKIKLSYLKDNDIVGLSEKIFKDRYFNSVYCISKEAIVYFVDSRIIQLFIEGCNNIRENKNNLLRDKYKVLTDLLLKQRKTYLDSFCTFQIDYAQEQENKFNANSIKKGSLLKSKKSYSRIISARKSKNMNIIYRNSIINEPEVKLRQYKSLGSVCEALTKDYKGISFEAKRKEKRMIFEKKYKLKHKNQNKSHIQSDKEMDMHIDALREIENQKVNYIFFKYLKLSSIKTLKSQSSCPDIFSSYNINKTNDSNNIHPNNKFIITKSFFKNEKEDNKEQKKNNDNNEELMPLNYDTLLKKNNKSYNSKILKVNDFFNSIKSSGYKASNIRLNKLKEIKANRDELFKQKLRNIYYSDFEKILLSKRLNL